MEAAGRLTAILEMPVEEGPEVVDQRDPARMRLDDRRDNFDRVCNDINRYTTLSRV